MKCPKCEIGNIITLRFKLSGEKAWACRQCDALWFLGEGLNPNRSHNFHAFSKDLERGNGEFFHTGDREHRSIHFEQYR